MGKVIAPKEIPHEPGTTGSPGTAAMMLISLLLVIVLASPSSRMQQALVLAMTIFWAYITFVLTRPTKDEAKKQAARVEKASQNPGKTGFSKQWYEAASKRVQKTIVKLLVAAVLLALVLCSVDVGNWVTTTWHSLKAYFSEPVLFLVMTYATHAVPFFTLLAVFTPLDLKRTASVMPYKMQENYVLTHDQFLICLRVTMKNEFMSFIYVACLWFVYPQFAPNGMGSDLPSAGVAIAQLLCCACIGETLFYFLHRMLHGDWFYKHVHHVHHDFHAPFVCMTMYSHWFEHLFVNMTNIVAGPLVMGVHVSVWAVWAFISTTTFTLGHTGFHIPLIPHTPEVHDFHHSQGWANLGTFPGLLDAIFGTNAPFLNAWQSTLSKVYMTASFPVDKILARQAHKEQPRIDVQPIQWTWSTMLDFAEWFMQLTSPADLPQPTETLSAFDTSLSGWSVEVGSCAAFSSHAGSAPDLLSAEQVLGEAQASAMGIKAVLSLGSFAVEDVESELPVVVRLNSKLARLEEASEFRICSGSGFGCQVAAAEFTEGSVCFKMNFRSSAAYQDQGTSHWALVDGNGNPGPILVQATMTRAK